MMKRRAASSLHRFGPTYFEFANGIRLKYSLLSMAARLQASTSWYTNWQRIRSIDTTLLLHRRARPGWNEVVYEDADFENDLGRRIPDCHRVLAVGFTQFGADGERAGSHNFRNRYCQQGLRVERGVGEAYPGPVRRSGQGQGRGAAY